MTFRLAFTPSTPPPHTHAHLFVKEPPHSYTLTYTYLYALYKQTVSLAGCPFNQKQCSFQRKESKKEKERKKNS